MPAPDSQYPSLVDTVAPVVAAAGYDLEGLPVRRTPGRVLIRVIVDADTSPDLDAIAELSRQVGQALEAAEWLREPYTLEVSSRGVDTPLTEPRHWRRAVGRLVKVSVAGTPRTGRVVGADDGGVTLDFETERKIYGYSEVSSGRIQVEFRHFREPGQDEEV